MDAKEYEKTFNKYSKPPDEESSTSNDEQNEEARQDSDDLHRGASWLCLLFFIFDKFVEKFTSKDDEEEREHGRNLMIGVEMRAGCVRYHCYSTPLLLSSTHQDDEEGRA